MEEVVKYRTKKNTKKWCKGKVGREHEYSDKEFIGLEYRGKIYGLIRISCDKCGKKGFSKGIPDGAT